MNLATLLKAAAEIGPGQISQVLIYRAGLATGIYRRLTPVGGNPAAVTVPARLDIFDLPERAALVAQLAAFDPQGTTAACRQADEILAGRVNLFGGVPAVLDLAPPGADVHWSQADAQVTGDVKLIWEPARLGWAFTLGRAYRLTGREEYGEGFWRYWEDFQAANPVNCGPNWASAQEVALRLIALAFVGQVFAGSPHSTDERMQALRRSLAEHAARIPVTLAYARAQNNNHLISEAAGMFLAGHLLPDHPQAGRWQRLGWRWFNRAIQSQVEDDGTYIQQSLAYHRLVLHLALLVRRVAGLEGRQFPEATRRKLEAATRWLLAQVDPLSGQAPNLGHNDGTQLLPLTGLDYGDYRPVAQAASIAFLGQPCLPGGNWDELAAWLGLSAIGGERLELPVESPAVRRLGNAHEWATLRARHYTSRPGQADQLQVELWHEGVNVLIDPGTYAYNLPEPWENGLALAEVHNAPMLAGCQPMRRAGKFTWLDWDQAAWLEEEGQPGKRLAALRFGYAHYGVAQRRTLEWLAEGSWRIADRLVGNGRQDIQLTWLLPDGDWQIEGNILWVRLATCQVRLSAACAETTMSIHLVRAGETLYGEPMGDERLGWTSPTYAKKVPALAFCVRMNSALPLEIVTGVEMKRLERREERIVEE